MPICHICHQQTPNKSYRCRPCNAKYVFDWQNKNKDKMRIARKKSFERSRSVDRTRYLAYKAVSNAVYRGKIIKPTQCSLCKSGGRIEAHHPNGYAKEFQLVIKWLCKSCHVDVHTSYTSL